MTLYAEGKLLCGEWLSVLSRVDDFFPARSNGGVGQDGEFSASLKFTSKSLIVVGLQAITGRTPPG